MKNATPDKSTAAVLQQLGLGAVFGCLAVASSVIAASWEPGAELKHYVSLGAVSSTLDPRGRSAGFSTDDNQGQGWRVGLGRRFGNHWSMELSYTDAGNAALSHSTNAMSEQFPDAGIGYRAPGASVSWQLRPHGERYNAFARAGVAALKTQTIDAPATVDIEQLNHTQTTLGAGLDWRLRGDMHVRLAHDVIDEDASWTSVSLVAGLGLPRRGALSREQSGAEAVRANAAAERLPPLIIEDRSALAPSPAAPVAALGPARADSRCQIENDISLSVHFHRDRDEVLADDEARLFLLSELLEERSPLIVRIAGHADARRGEHHNQALAARRARNVATAFAGLNNSARNWEIDTFSVGEREPVAANNNPIGRAANRRVELRIRCPE